MWAVSRPDYAPELILVEADYVLLTDEQAGELVAAIEAARQGRAEYTCGQETR